MKRPKTIRKNTYFIFFGFKRSNFFGKKYQFSVNQLLVTHIKKQNTSLWARIKKIYFQRGEGYSPLSTSSLNLLTTIGRSPG